jgi:hypothetical protein
MLMLRALHSVAAARRAGRTELLAVADSAALPVVTAVPSVTSSVGGASAVASDVTPPLTMLMEATSSKGQVGLAASATPSPVTTAWMMRAVLIGVGLGVGAADRLSVNSG